MSQGDTLTSVFVDILLYFGFACRCRDSRRTARRRNGGACPQHRKMAGKNAVVKRSYGGRGAGSATVICSDKTGTLTQNKMSLTGVFDGQRYVTTDNLDKCDF